MSVIEVSFLKQPTTYLSADVMLLNCVRLVLEFIYNNKQ